jgi:hypothetical protein
MRRNAEISRKVAEMRLVKRDARICLPLSIVLVIGLLSWSVYSRPSVAQFPQIMLGKPLDCNSPPVRQKLVFPLREFMEKIIQENAAMNGIRAGRVVDVQVISTSVIYTGAPSMEGMLYQQCEVTGVAVVETADGRTGRIPIPNLQVGLGYDERGTLHVKSPNGQLF